MSTHPAGYEETFPLRRPDHHRLVGKSMATAMAVMDILRARGMKIPDLMARMSTQTTPRRMNGLLIQRSERLPVFILHDIANALKVPEVEEEELVNAVIQLAQQEKNQQQGADAPRVQQEAVSLQTRIDAAKPGLREKLAYGLGDPFTEESLDPHYPPTLSDALIGLSLVYKMRTAELVKASSVLYNMTVKSKTRGVTEEAWDKLRYYINGHYEKAQPFATNAEMQEFGKGIFLALAAADIEPIDSLEKRGVDPSRAMRALIDMHSITSIELNQRLSRVYKALLSDTRLRAQYWDALLPVVNEKRAPDAQFSSVEAMFDWIAQERAGELAAQAGKESIKTSYGRRSR